MPIGLVPVLERVLAREVVDVVPAPGRMLRLDQRQAVRSAAW